MQKRALLERFGAIVLFTIATFVMTIFGSNQSSAERKVVYNDMRVSESTTTSDPVSLFDTRGLPDEAAEILEHAEKDVSEINAKAERETSERLQRAMRSLVELRDRLAKPETLEEAFKVRQKIFELNVRRLGIKTETEYPGSTAICYSDKIGKRTLLVLTGGTAGGIWGDGVYTYDSNLATAAVHSGVLKAGETGVVAVSCVAGQSSYGASTKNGVASSSYTEYPASIKLERYDVNLYEP